LEDLFSSVLSKFKNYHPSGNLKFNNLGIFQSLKLRNLMGKILSIALKLNFTPITTGCYGITGMEQVRKVRKKSVKMKLVSKVRKNQGKWLQSQ